MKQQAIIATLVVTAAALAGCQDLNQTQEYTLGGAALGAGAGAIIGAGSGNAATGAAIGAAAGAVGGALLSGERSSD